MDPNFLALRKKIARSRFDEILTNNSIEELQKLADEGKLTFDEIALFGFNDFWFLYAQKNYPELNLTNNKILPLNEVGEPYSDWRAVVIEMEKFRDLGESEYIIDIHADTDFSDLPNEIIHLIALQLTYPDIVKLCQTNRKFSKICSDQVFWKNKAIQEWNLKTEVFENSNISHQERYIKLFKLHRQLKAGFVTFYLVGELFIYGDVETAISIPIEKYFPNANPWLTVRSDIADNIEKHWVGHEYDSKWSIQFVTLNHNTGLIRILSSYQELISRKDLVQFEDFKKANIYIKSDKNGNPIIEIQPNIDPKSIDRAAYEAAALHIVNKNRDFWDHEVKFINDKPWLQLDGLTPSQAVVKLRKLGW